MQKTLGMKLLEGKKIPYEVVIYPETMRDATEIALRLGVSPGHLFKTLVVQAPAGVVGGKPMLVLVPGDRQLNLKKLARAVGAKKLKMATHAEAEAMTGLQVGGISPLALLGRGFAVYVDGAAQSLSHIYVSAGTRGTNLRVPVAALMNLVGARWVDAAG